MHNALHQGVLSVGLTRAIGDDRGAAGIERYGETLTPTIDLWQQPEWAYLRVERLCSIWRSQGAVVAEVSYLALVNPAGSQLVAVLERCSIQTAAAGQGFLQMNTEAAALATLAGPASGNVRDRRNQPQGQTICYTLAGSDASTGIGVALEVRRVAVAQNIDFQHLPIVITPGFAVMFCFATVNTGIDGNFMWRERRAFPGELE